MSEKTKESLSVLMKKQISEKSSKKTVHKKSASAEAKNLEQGTDAEKKGADQEEEMTEEEQLEEAKKASRNKAAGRDQSEMLKKLFLETVGKYLLVVTAFAILAIGVITIGPEIVKFFNKLIYNLFLGSLPK